LHKNEFTLKIFLQPGLIDGKSQHRTVSKKMCGECATFHEGM